MKTRLVLLVVGLGAMCSCSYTEKIVKAQPGATEVKVVRPDDKPFHCQVLGDIQGTSRAEDKDKARGGAENDLKNRAAALKGNYALVETDRSNPVGSTSYTETVLIGKALKCEDQS
ncbi:MAG TPA: DUF4156 domain-containing protein [Polyangiaceae bacterium]|jgi:hypothetical protein|nr:DUF4156 domain-containing protein [Polyangiaceae bacterium]